MLLLYPSSPQPSSTPRRHLIHDEYVPQDRPTCVPVTAPACVIANTNLSPPPQLPLPPLSPFPPSSPRPPSSPPMPPLAPPSVPLRLADPPLHLAWPPLADMPPLPSAQPQQADASFADRTTAWSMALAVAVPSALVLALVVAAAATWARRRRKRELQARDVQVAVDRAAY